MCPRGILQAAVLQSFQRVFFRPPPTTAQGATKSKKAYDDVVRTLRELTPDHEISYRRGNEFDDALERKGCHRYQ